MAAQRRHKVVIAASRGSPFQGGGALSTSESTEAGAPAMPSQATARATSAVGATSSCSIAFLSTAPATGRTSGLAGVCRGGLKAGRAISRGPFINGGSPRRRGSSCRQGPIEVAPVSQAVPWSGPSLRSVPACTATEKAGSKAPVCPEPELRARPCKKVVSSLVKALAIMAKTLTGP